MKKITILAILIVLLLPTALAFAVDDTYKVLVPLPGVGDTGDGTTTLQKYVPAMFKIAIGLATVAAVLMIVIGGFQYMTSDAIQGKSEGKSRIQNAIIGLVLVIGAWIILYTVNPDLLTLNLNIKSATTTSPPGGGGTLGGTTGGPKEGSIDILVGATLADDTAKRNALVGVGVNRDPCTKVGVACTNLNGIPSEMITAMNNLNRQCDTTFTDCPILITGGTETYAHASHGPGKSIVDISPNSKVNEYLGIPNPTSGQWSERTVPNGTLKFTYENTGDGGRSTAPHWHVVFTPKP